MSPRPVRLLRGWRCPGGWSAGVALVVSLGVSPVVADTVTLRSGQVIEGRVLEETDEIVVFQDMNRIVLRLRRDQVIAVEIRENPLQALDEADAAMRRSDFGEAIEAFERALELGADEARIAPRLAEARRKYEDSLLGRYGTQIARIRADIQEGRLDAAEAQAAELLEQLESGEDDVRVLVRGMTSDIIYRKALLLLDAIDTPRAEQELRRALEYNANNVRACIELARLYASVSSRRQQAIDLYLRALDMTGSRMDIEERLGLYWAVAELYVQTNQHDKAADYYEKVYQERPNFRPVLAERYVNALRQVVRQNEVLNPEVAVDALDRALIVRPFDNDMRSDLARALMNSGNLDRSIEEYQRLLADAANYPRANQNLAKVYLQQGDIVSARAHLEREVQLAPENYDAAVDLGDIFMRMGDIDQAQQIYSRARQLRPGEIRAVLALARSERILGNYTAARRYIQEVLLLRPDDIRTNLERGLLARDEKLYDESTASLEYVLELIEALNPVGQRENREIKADALLALGEVKLLTRGPSTATIDFNRALEVYPDYPAAYFNIGAAYEKKYNSSKSLEDLVEAEKNMLKARELSPRNPEFAYGLGVFYHQVMATADNTNQEAHFAKAIENYKDYINEGGAQVSRVESWIRELGGTPEQ